MTAKSNQSTRNSELGTWYYVSPVLIGVVLFVILFFSANHYGLTTDEPIYMSKAGRANSWLDILLTDPGYAVSREAITAYWYGKDQHPGFVKLVEAVCLATPLGRYGPFSGLRCGTIFLVSLSMALLYAFLGREIGAPGALLGVGLTVMLPRVFVHSHLLALDAPIMAMNLLFALAFFEADRTGRWHWAIVMGVLFGLALGTKLNAFMTPIALLAWWLIFSRKEFVKLAAGILVVGPAVFFAAWPWLWIDTWAHLVAYLRFHLGHGLIAVDYFGKTYTQAPWHYPIVITLITTPAVALIAWALGIGRVIRERPVARWPMLFLFSALIQVIFVSLPSSPKYNGVRLFLPIFPFLAGIGAWGVIGAVAWVSSRLPKHDWTTPGRLSWIAAGLIIVLVVSATGNSHPFQMSYYNGLIGGASGAVARGMEPTYWGETYLAALMWMTRNVSETEPIIFVSPPGYQATMETYQEVGAVPSAWRFTGDTAAAGEADYAVFHLRRNEIGETALRLVARAKPAYTVELQGAALCVVYAQPEIGQALGSGDGYP